MASRATRQNARYETSKTATKSREWSARDNMGAFLEYGSESARHERAIASLTARTDASLEEVSGLYAAELARLRLSARVQGYLQILTTSKVRSILRRAGKIPRP